MENKSAAPPAELTPIKAAPRMDIPWDRIVPDLQHGMSMPEAARLYQVKYDTIKQYVKRNKVVMPSRKLQHNIERNLHAAVEAAVEKIAEKWVEKGEAHRVVAFEKAHESVKKFKIKAPANFRELEAADKIARRAAGLETADTIQQTLINVNELGDGTEAPREVTEATVVESPAQAAQLTEPTQSPAPQSVQPAQSSQ